LQLFHNHAFFRAESTLWLRGFRSGKKRRPGISFGQRRAVGSIDLRSHGYRLFQNHICAQIESFPAAVERQSMVRLV
jgi:hypothetical protein